MQLKDPLWQNGTKEQLWQKYCGFFDLTLEEFMDIQKRLLMDQIDTIHDSVLARKFMSQKPKNLDEFRKVVPLTTYEDYAEYLAEKDESILAAKPFCWTCTSGRGGSSKWIPWTDKGAEAFANAGIAAAILACANNKYEVNIKSGMRALANLPPPPYGAGILPKIMTERIGIQMMPPYDSDNVDFAARTQLGFAMGLRYGVNLLTSLTSVLVKMGETFAESSGKMKFSPKMLHPSIMRRLILATVRSKIEKRKLLPKDLWPLDGLVAYGMDTAIYRDRVKYYWGRTPLEIYGGTEACTLATQAWNKRYMTFQPYSVFFEFIPAEESIRSWENKGYHPSTMLLDELEPGKCYEIVITSYHGMPLMRYQLGDLVKVIASEDLEAGIKLPQIIFQSRVDGIIDIGGFTRLDEKTIWQAIASAGIRFEDWTARKELEQNNSILVLYIEMKEEIEVDKLEKLLHEKLASIDTHYKDVEMMLGLFPLHVNLLRPGSFQRYYEEKHRAGADLAHLKPPHINAPDSVINTLLSIGV